MLYKIDNKLYKIDNKYHVVSGDGIWYEPSCDDSTSADNYASFLSQNKDGWFCVNHSGTILSSWHRGLRIYLIGSNEQDITVSG